MLPLSHVINSSTLSTHNIITTSSVYHQLTATKQTRRRPTTIAKITTVPTTSLFSVNTTNITSLSSPSTEQQQVSFEDPYSAKTGIKTAALLGGMLFLVVLHLIWKARARLCRSLRSSSGRLGHPRLSATKFDLDYWLKQVDILEAKEVERNRGGQSLYLELPTSEPRDNRDATASWITDAYRQWRLTQYRQQQQLLRQTTDQQADPPPVPYRRRRRNLLRRLVRRLFTSSRQHSPFLMESSPTLIADMRPSIVSNHFIPPALTSNLQLRRASSWPRLRSNHHQIGAPMSALQTHLARKRLLKRSSRTTFDI